MSEVEREEPKMESLRSGERGGGVRRYGCPIFSGEKEDYDEWRLKVEDWLLLAERTGETFLGVEIRMNLKGKALDVARNVGREVLKAKGGELTLLRKLDSVFKRDAVSEKYGKLTSYLQMERRKGEKVEDYLNRYERASDECERIGITPMAEEMKGCHLIEQTNISENQKQMIIAACGGDSLDFGTVRRIMKRVFEGVGGESEKREDCWRVEYPELGREPERRMIQKETRPSRTSKNPVKNGKVTVCAICSSEYHWARECPKNYRNQKNRDRGGKEEVFAGMSFELTDEWSAVEAILDTGCNSSVIGNK